MPRDALPARVTMRDVALAAGVSPSTVSKVLNNRTDVGADVRVRVAQTISRLGYRPNAMARGLRSRRSDTIAILTDDLEGIFTNALMRGVEDAASDYDVSVLLCNSYGDVERERRHLSRLIDKQVDGLVVMSGNRVRRRSSPALPSAIPYVFLYEYSDDTSVPSVLPDDYQGAQLAVRHLLASGRRRIGFVNGPAAWEATQDRLRGYRDELRSHGVAFDASLVLFADRWHPEDGYNLTASLLSAPVLPDAIFCASDDLAVGALSALRDREVRIPDEVAVVGFDDRSLAVHQRPPLTTMALPLIAMGRCAGDLLLSAIHGNEVAGGQVRIPCELIVRESSGIVRLGPTTRGSKARSEGCSFAPHEVRI